MDWLLTQEEINAARFQASCIKGYLPTSEYGLELLIDEVIKAQAKKIVEKLPVVARSQTFHEVIIHISETDWQSLLKEVEE